MINFSYKMLGPPTPITHRNKLAGNVTVDGVPAKRFVMVFERMHMSIVAATYSDAETGNWAICGLPEYSEKGLLVMALDTIGAYNAEVADYVSQVATV